MRDYCIFIHGPLDALQKQSFMAGYSKPRLEGKPQGRGGNVQHLHKVVPGPRQPLAVSNVHLVS